MREGVERYTAAGGVIVRDELVLVLAWPSRDEVRLPKGHVEPGETLQEAAIREAREESGYRELEIKADLGSQCVAFEKEGRPVVRTEHYFLMTLSRGASKRPRSGESQFDPTWLTWDQALRAMTFEAEREWVRRARRAAALDESIDRDQ